MLASGTWCIMQAGLRRIFPWLLLVGFLLVVISLVIRAIDSTHAAIFVCDSPDGKYRCAIFRTGSVRYSAGLFEGHWPHRELSGTRAEWTHDSVDSSDFNPT